MITPELKDRILFDIVNAGIELRADIDEEGQTYETDPDIYSAVLDQFETMGFIRLHKNIGGVFSLL